MSHTATTWAIKQRGISPAEKIVLWQLCDRYHPDHGCFPSQATLADDCEMSRATVNRALDRLAKAGLIQRERRANPLTGAVQSTLYRFPFESAVSQNDTGAVSQNGGVPCLKSSRTRVSKCDTNLVTEPVKEPVRSKPSKLIFPEDWQPSERLMQWVFSEGFTEVEVARQAKLCVLHYRAKGEKFPDLEAKFKGWLLRYKSFTLEDYRLARSTQTTPTVKTSALSPSWRAHLDARYGDQQ